jgi:hypothetical protein
VRWGTGDRGGGTVTGDIGVVEVGMGWMGI